MRCAARGDGALALELGAPVRVERMRRVGLDVRALLRSIEDVIGRVVDEERPGAARLLCKRPRSHRIHRARQRLVGLGAIDGGVRRGIDDDIRPRLAHARGDIAGPREVERRAIVRDHLGASRERAHHLSSDLPARARHEHADHEYVSAWASGVPAASRGLRTGGAPTGHAMPIAGSFHSSVRSSSGA